MTFASLFVKWGLHLLPPRLLGNSIKQLTCKLIYIASPTLTQAQTRLFWNQSSLIQDSQLCLELPRSTPEQWKGKVATSPLAGDNLLSPLTYSQNRNWMQLLRPEKPTGTLREKQKHTHQSPTTFQITSKSMVWNCLKFGVGSAYLAVTKKSHLWTCFFHM